LKLSDINGQLISLVTSAVSLVIAFLTAFHVLHLTTAESNAILPVAIGAVGLGVYAYSLIQSWATATYDQARVTTLITAFVAALMALLSAFGVFNFTGEQQATVLGVAGGLAFMGGILFSYLHTGKQVAMYKLQLQKQGYGSMAPQRSR
jgi:hypothetical protein